MPYRWEPTAGVSGRYRDTSTGRYVQGATVRRELDRYLDTADPAKALAEALRGRQVSLADWEVGMRRVVKNTHLNAIALERGGWANMTPADYGRAGQIIREQYGYLRGFAADIASGKQRLDGTLGVRAKLYSQAGRNSYYRSKAANMSDKVTHQMSVRSARDSCRQCLDLDRKVFRIDDASFPLPGRRVCNHNCQCHLAYLALGDDRENYETVETV
jgi:hypothetical protein